MKTIFQHIDTIREKPHHIRKRIALGGAGGVTAVIAVIWLSANLAAGSFAIKDPVFVDSSQTAVITTTPEGSPNLAAAAAAAADKTAPIHIEVVNTATTTPVVSNGAAEQTVVPF